MIQKKDVNNLGSENVFDKEYDEMMYINKKTKRLF